MLHFTSEAESCGINKYEIKFKTRLKKSTLLKNIQSARKCFLIYNRNTDNM